MTMLKKLLIVIFSAVGLASLAQAQNSSEKTSYLALEVNTGRVLWSSNAEQVRPISSLSQVATALVTLDWIQRRGISLDQAITVPMAVQSIKKTNPLNLRPGDRIKLRDAVFSTVLAADSASAYTLAHYVGADLTLRAGGGDPIQLFVAQMNKLAQSIGMVRTSFVGPHGLDVSGRRSESCAVDMALLGMYAMQNDVFPFIARQKSRQIAVETPAGVQEHIVNNTNPLIGVDGIDGIKTANSLAASPCALITATRQPVKRTNAAGTSGIYNQRLIIVILGMPDAGQSNRFTFAKQLVTDGWREWDAWQRAGESYANQKDFIRFPSKPVHASGSRPAQPNIQQQPVQTQPAPSGVSSDFAY